MKFLLKIIRKPIFYSINLLNRPQVEIPYLQGKIDLENLTTIEFSTIFEKREVKLKNLKKID